MIISGLKQLDNDIDVFLEPFMEDMKILWEDGVKMMDASQKEFTLKAIIFVTITGQLPRYQVDDIVEPTTCMLQVCFGRA